MAVFTTFSQTALERYLVMFDIGDLQDYSPISSGIENSNYFLRLAREGDLQEFVLTITENLTFEEIPFFNALFSQLARAGLPVPDPQRTLDGMSSTIFCGKPTWLFPKLKGQHPRTITPAQCVTAGTHLARIHAAASGAPYSRVNPYDWQWATTTLSENAGKFSTQDHAMLSGVLAEHAVLPMGDDLPRGIIHGDLFRDNTLFAGDMLTGVIDFYHACEDFLVQDLAIAINDWCRDPGGQIDRGLVTALKSGYESVRQLTDTEAAWLPVFQRIGALRFVLTRILSGSDGVHLKDPEEFLNLLRQQTASGEP
jgi:homoserine kinase type II